MKGVTQAPALAPRGHSDGGLNPRSRDGCTTLAPCARLLALRRESCQDAGGWTRQNQAGETGSDTLCDLGAPWRPCFGGGEQAERALHRAG
jgi:hypothetical protein